MTKTKVEAVKAARVWCLAALLAFAGLAHADLVGPVVAIQDGDTIDVLAVEMEGAAVAQVCLDYGVPFAAVRTISDRADDAAHGDFALFVQTVASRYADHMVQTFLQKL